MRAGDERLPELNSGCLSSPSSYERLTAKVSKGHQWDPTRRLTFHLCPNVRGGCNVPYSACRASYSCSECRPRRWRAALLHRMCCRDARNSPDRYTPGRGCCRSGPMRCSRFQTTCRPHNSRAHPRRRRCPLPPVRHSLNRCTAGSLRRGGDTVHVAASRGGTPALLACVAMVLRAAVSTLTKSRRTPG